MARVAVVKLAVCVTHAPWIAGRVESMARLREQLDVAELRELMPYREETTRAANFVWSELQWRWSASTPATHALFLQDDVELAPDFFRTLRAMLDGRPNDVLGFSCAHPGARTVFLEGLPGYTTCDGLIGIGYALPTELLREFLRWRIDELIDDGARRMTEDSLLALFCLTRDIPIFHPTPTILDHDLELASTYKNDGHWYRKPQVTWRELDRVSDGTRRGREADALDPKWWAGAVPHLGRFYQSLHEYAPVLLRDTELGLAIRDRAAADRCPPKYTPYFLNVDGVQTAAEVPRGAIGADLLRAGDRQARPPARGEKAV